MMKWNQDGTRSTKTEKCSWLQNDKPVVMAAALQRFVCLEGESTTVPANDRIDSTDLSCVLLLISWDRKEREINFFQLLHAQWRLMTLWELERYPKSVYLTGRIGATYFSFAHLLWQDQVSSQFSFPSLRLLYREPRILLCIQILISVLSLRAA